MANDAELSVGIEDNLTPVLAKMAAQTRQFGSTIGAESKQIDKAVQRVTKSINDLGNAGGARGGKSSPLAANIAATRREMERLESLAKRASSITTSTTSFSGFRENGKGIRASEAKEILNAADAYKKLEDQLRSLQAQESRMAGSGRAAEFRKSQEAMFTIDPSVLNRAARDRDTLQNLYNGMWTTLGDQTKLKKTESWFPPAMFRDTERFTQSIMDMSNSTRYAMYDIARTTAVGGAAILALSVGAVVAAARWERAFADVERTVQGTPAVLEQVRQGLVALSTDIPVSFSNLSEIASIGGQMGIAAEGIVAYTETIAKLTATTNLTADSASKALGRFKAFFAEANDPSLAVTEQTFANLASSILKVGVNSVATESGIVGVATQISSMGSYAGFTADQVIGLAGALSSVGVPPELSRGVITRLFNNIGEAVSENGVRLQSFAQLAGVSSEEFVRAWGTEKFAYVFTNMVAGLNSVAAGGGDAVQTLHELGITSVRDVPVLLRLASAAGEAGTAGSLLAQTMNDARSGWRQSIELTLQYNKIADTLSERTKVLFQNFEALFATLGKGAVGPVKDMVNGLITLVKGFTSIIDTPLGQTLGVITLAAAALAGGLLLLTAGAARTFGALQGVAAGLQAIGISAAVATPAVRILGLAIAGITVVGAIAAVIGLIASLQIGAEEASNAIIDTQGAVAAMRDDAERGQRGLFQLGGAGSAAAAGLKETSTQADILAGISDNTTDKLYGTGAAADDLATRTASSALSFGKSAQSFVKSALLANKAFTDLFAGDQGTELGEALLGGDFSLDTLIQKVAKGGRAAGEAYLEGITGVKPNADVFEDIGNSWIWLDQTAAETARSTGAMLDQVAGSVDGMKAAGNAALAAGNGMVAFSSATEMSSAAMEEFQVQNEEAINSIAQGFAKFVDTSSLIGLTQQMNAAFATLDDGSTDVDEHAEAIAGFEQAWLDAYGGARFSIDEYMGVFRRAAAEQQFFIANLQTLAARGVPTNIIGDLAAMGPQAQALVSALINATDEQLAEYVDLYGSTGFDSMVALAAGQLAAEQIVRNAAKHLSTAQIQQLSADLSAGTPLADAMAKWQLDAEGNPMEAPADAYLRPGWEPGFQNQMNRSGISVPVSPYLTRSTLTIAGGGGGSASMKFAAAGGYISGPGTGTSDSIPARLSNGEFVMTAAATRAIGVDNLYAMMRSAQSGRPARQRGNGYAAGGLVSSDGGSTSLSAHDRKLLRAIADRVGLYVDGRDLANAAGAANENSFRRGAN
jgi:TP901 family phage tail tape measure protein